MDFQDLEKTFYIFPVLNIIWQLQIANTNTLLLNIYNITMHKAELNCTQAIFDMKMTKIQPQVTLNKIIYDIIQSGFITNNNKNKD